MVFSDQVFVFFFLPIALLICLPTRRTRYFAVTIALSSLAFFYWESGSLTIILLFSIAMNYLGGLLLWKRKKHSVLVILIAANLGLLAYFKYTAFTLGIFGFFGEPSIERYAAGIILPIGISFYTFQGISYLIDVWRGDTSPERNLITFTAYQSFFPQLIAGPIVRYADVKQDLNNPITSVHLFAYGAARFLLGLCKKVLVADTVAPIANAAFFSGQDLTFASAWIGALAFTVQIYFDFSGYSDMAIGLAAMFGIRFKENFNHPYAASTITEFWRRWHISLSTWFRDYLYIPLGGNRLGERRTYVNLSIVFILTGFWHGAAWTFVLWGAYHGAFLVFEKVFRIGRTPSTLLRFVYFFPITVIGWTLFQSPSLGRFTDFMQHMFAPFTSDALTLNSEMIVALSPQALLAFCVGFSALLVQGRYKPLGVFIQESGSSRAKFIRVIFIAGAALMASIYVLPQDFSPFLYFRF